MRERERERERARERDRQTDRQTVRQTETETEVEKLQTVRLKNTPVKQTSSVVYISIFKQNIYECRCDSNDYTLLRKYKKRCFLIMSPIKRLYLV